MDKFNDRRDGSWASYEKYVIAELTRMTAEIAEFHRLAKEARAERENIRQRLVEIETAVKVKQAMWGFISGFLGVIITVIIEWLKSK